MNKELIKKCYEAYKKLLTAFKKIDKYYYGETDSLANFQPIEGRSNLKVNTNFIQDLVDEEADYSFGNTLTYTANDDNKEMVKLLNYHLKNNAEDHDITLGTELVKNGIAFEINYLDKNGKFKNRIVSPLNGYMYFDEYDEPSMFLHIFSRELENKTYIDCYTDKAIYHLNEGFEPIAPPTEHYFNCLPVGCGFMGKKDGSKTIFKTIKTLQDAFETNLSDNVCEISDLRNAILKLYNVDLEKEDENGNKIAPINKNNNILVFGNKNEEDAEWLTKNINDTFIKNTRDDIRSLIYSLTKHVDTSEKLQSNLSGVALRSRLQGLESKCKKNEKAMTNIIKTRLKCLFKYIYIITGKEFDSNMIEIKYTPNIPIDETSIAQIISQLPQDVVSNETKRSWLPRISDVEVEADKIRKEKQEMIDSMANLDSIGGGANAIE